ncbi:MAG: anthranilate synthase component I family protein [Thermoprotei archaeon]
MDEGKRDWESVASELRELIKTHGLVLGYTSFSALSLWDKVPYTSPTPFHDLEYLCFDDLIVLDSAKSYIGGRPPECAPNTHFSSKSGNIEGRVVFEKPGFDGYIDMVRRAKKYIGAGEVFQVVLARKLGVEFNGSYTSVFMRLLEKNPSPYMYYFKVGERRIIGSSPETLARVRGQRVETYPIAGTRRVTGNPELDEALRIELLRSPKEAAEHVMLVDLARNDLGRVSRFGSVRVTLYRKVLKYSHVQHLVSKVVGTLRDGVDSVDVFRAVFPAGTVCGAPKVRAAQLIHELEGEPRGPYAGSVGYFMGANNMDMAINIRSLYSYGSLSVVQAGAGIVASSDPVSEYYETEHKARVVVEALRVGGLEATEP